MKSLNALILRNRHARYEDDIFSMIKHCLFVLRTFEFVEIDNAIDVIKNFREHYANDSFANRFWHINYKVDRLNEKSKSEMILFDAKSVIDRYAKNHEYLIFERQRRKVAFYFCICAMNSFFVELISNFFQKFFFASRYESNDFEKKKSNDDKVVNNSRKSRLHFNAYKLSSCNSSYRMSLAMLFEALNRVRNCVQ